MTLPEIARKTARYKGELSEKERRLLRRAGVTDAQFAAAVALSMLFERLMARAQAAIPEVTHAQVQRYYRHHRAHYRHLSRRRALERIETNLKQRREWRAAERFFTGFMARYTKLTVCAEGYVVDLCANADSDGSDGDSTYEPSLLHAPAPG